MHFESYEGNNAWALMLRTRMALVVYGMGLQLSERARSIIQFLENSRKKTIRKRPNERSATTCSCLKLKGPIRVASPHHRWSGLFYATFLCNRPYRATLMDRL